jgi:hypothetical protein
MKTLAATISQNEQYIFLVLLPTQLAANMHRLIHTGIHSKLGVEKVCKTTMVGLDIEHAHLEAGLLHA